MTTADDRALGVKDEVETRPTRGRSGMVVPRVFSTEGVSPFDQVEWDLRDGRDQGRAGPGHLPADRLRDPQGLEPARDQRRGQQVLLRRDQHRPSASTSVRQLVDRVTRTIADWGREDGYFATADDAERFYDELTALCLNQYGSFNSPVWFNVGLYPPLRDRRPGQQLAVGRGDPLGRPGRPSAYQYPAGLGLLHPERRRRHGGHHAAGDHRGDALQVRLGHRHRPLDPPLEPGEALRRRQAVRPGQLHAGLRRDRQRRQVGRQDPPRRQDADPQGLAPRHPRIHRVQDQGGEEGPDADRRRATRPTSTARPTARSCSRTPTSRSAPPTPSSAPSRPTASGPPAPSPPAGRWTPTRPGC